MQKIPNSMEVAMKRYVIKRLGLGLITILFSFTFTFFLIRYAPGDPIKLLAGRENPNPDQIEYIRAMYGLDQPLYIQFIEYIKNLFQGDFGFSFKSNKDVLEIIASRIRPTLILSLTSSTLSMFIGTFLGVFIVRKSNKKLDRTALSVSYFIDAIPTFWLGLILILVFSSKLGWFPTSGMHNIRERYTGFTRILDEIYHMILPVSTIVIVQVHIYFRVIRSSVLDVMGDPYIQLFQATGMSDKHIFNKYVLKNAILPIIILYGSSLAFTLSGVALIEIIFAWPGMGRLIIDAINSRDYMVLNGIYLIISISVIIFMILIDIVQATIDPRVRMR